MQILVCVKQVPDTGEIRISKDNTLVRDGVTQIMNPADESALEAALLLRDSCGGSVRVLSMGPPRAETMLREAISRSADEAVLMADSAFAGADTLITARCLKAYIDKTGPYDAIFCGRRTLDGETAQVGPMLASMLGCACIPNANHIEADAACLRVRQQTEAGEITWEAGQPALITFCEWCYRLRLPTLKGLRRARTASIDLLKPQDIGILPENCGLKASPTRVMRISTNTMEMRSCKRIRATDVSAILKESGVL